MMVVSGRVRAFRAVTRNRVQIWLDNRQDTFELFLDQAWVISRGDHVRLAGERDETGKICCYAYENASRAVRGWTEEVRVSRIFQGAPLAFGIALNTIVGFKPFSLLWIVFGVIWAAICESGTGSNHLYRKAKEALWAGRHGRVDPTIADE